MKSRFEEPLCEIVQFKEDIVSTSLTCGCDVGGIVFEGNETCSGGNIQCTCSPNADDPSVNCV